MLRTVEVSRIQTSGAGTAALRSRPADRYLGVPVLTALQSFQDRAEQPFSRGLVLFEGTGLPGEPGDASRQTRSALGSQDAPAEEAVRTPQTGLGRAALEQPLQRGVQRLRLFEGEFDRRAAGISNGSSPGRCGPG
jgi:hypothetical protein